MDIISSSAILWALQWWLWAILETSLTVEVTHLLGHLHRALLTSGYVCAVHMAWERILGTLLPAVSFSVTHLV